MKRTIIALLLLSASVLNSTTAQTIATNSIIDQMVDEIVVTATRTPLPLKETPVITRVITAAEIEDQAIATLESLLERELAGVEFHQAGYGTTMSFQGLDARYVLFMIDGERIAGETYGNIDYSRIPMSAVERVEIVRGASSVLYGSNAMGAVVNVITKMPKKRVEVSGALRYGTYFQTNKDETLGTAATSEQTNKYHNKIDLPNIKGELSVGFNTGKFRSLTTGSFRTVDGYKLFGSADEMRHYKKGNLSYMAPEMINIIGPGGVVVGQRPNIDPDTGMPVFIAAAQNGQDTTVIAPPDSRGLAVSGYRDWYVGQKMDYTFNDKFRVEVSGNYFKKDRYDLYTSLMDDNPMSGMIPSSAPYKYEQFEGYDVKFLMEHSPNERNKIYLSYMRDEYFRYERDLDHNLTPKQRHTYNIPRLLWTLKAGEWNRITSGMELINERLRFDLNSSAARYGDTESVNTGAIYVQDEILSDRKLSFVVGLRGDWSDKFGWRVTPKVSAKYSFGDFSLRGNYSNGYRSPSLKEMYMVLDLDISSAPKIHGNPNLKSETNHYLSLSLDYNRSWLNLSATINKSYFHNKIDVRLLRVEGASQVMQYENIDRSELGTLELIGRFRVTRGLFINANYNYIYQSDNAPEESTQYIFPSAHTARFSVDYGFMVERTRLSFNANVRYVGAKDYEDFMPYIERTPTESIYYTGTYQAHMKQYAVCNISAHAQFRRNVGITAGLDNMFDYKPKVVCFNTGVMPGMNFFMRLSFDF